MSDSNQTDVSLQLKVGPSNHAGVLAPARSDQHLPATIPVSLPRRRLRWSRVAVVLAVLAAGTFAGAYWWLHRPPPLPPGIVFGNGRIEADPIDIATKFAGRIFELRVDEGAMVRAGQVVAVMDTRDLAASLKKSEAQVEQARKLVNEAHANVDQQRSQRIFAEQEMERARELMKKGWITKETFDQRQQQVDTAKAAELAAQVRVTAAEHALDAATHDVELYKVNIADNTLVAPRDGRIEYRIANVGEVLPAGGKVFTMLDISYVYMDIYLPTLSAGRIKSGDDARIVLDAYPDHKNQAQVRQAARQSRGMRPSTWHCGGGLIQIAIRSNTDLLRKSLVSCHSRLPIPHRHA